MSGDDSNSILLVLGRIEGELKGIRELVHSTSQATNTRIDDLTSAVNKRIDDHQMATQDRIDGLQKQIHRKSLTVGGLSAALVTGVVEIIRVTLND
ncbi:MAG: hypothetical protein JKX92_12320 [Porticoccaceae bacterium]|nr:hypothetical protein [Porticoccaceae bacterium]